MIAKLILIFSFLTMGFAQTMPPDPSHADQEALKREGRLFSIQIVPRKPIQIFVVGREEAQLDLSKLKLFVRRLTPKPSKSFGVEKSGDHYILTEPVNFEKPVDLEVTAKALNKSETFKLRIQRP